MWIKSFKTGTHTDINGKKTTFTTGDLDAIVEDYAGVMADSASRKAPAVVGHPNVEDRAYGWLKGVKREGEYLYVKLGEVNKAFAELVNDGAYKYVSLCLRPDKKRIRHLGFLGAHPPGVQGLGEVPKFAFGEEDVAGYEFQFGEGEELVYKVLALGRLMQGVRAFLIDQFGIAKADEVVPQGDIDWVKEPIQENSLPYAGDNTETEMTAEEKQELETLRADKARLTGEVEALTAEKSTLSFAAQQTEDKAFIASLRESDHANKKGPKLTAAQEASALDLLSVARGAGDFAFAEGDGTATKPAVEVLKSFLSALPEALPYGEVADVENARPPGTNDEVEAKVKEKMEANTDLSYGAALREVFIEFPLLAAAAAQEA